MSPHPGGVMMAMGDGSVRFIPDEIDYVLYQHLGDKADHATIQSDF